MDVEKDLLALEEGLWRANREGDGAFYDRVLRDDALVVSRYGVAGKADIVRIISENQNPFTRTDLSGQRVIPLTDASALITYRVDYTALVGGEDVNLSALATSVYVREGDQWRSVLHQQTTL